MRQNSSQTIAASSDVKIKWDSIEINVGNIINTTSLSSTGTWNFNSTGLYQVNYMIQLSGSATGSQRNIQIADPSGNAIYQDKNNFKQGNDISLELSTIVNVSSTSQLYSASIYHDSGVNLTTSLAQLSISTVGGATPAGPGIPYTTGFVNAGVPVILDNIKVQIPASGNKSLQLATISNSFFGLHTGYATSYNGSSNQFNNYGNGSTTFTTSFQYFYNWNFTYGGDTIIYHLNDTSNMRCYRITCMIGLGYNNNMISIERLV